jgi:diacylglycerol diphosphate phosphatase/phosphatidate phosphatase
MYQSNTLIQLEFIVEPFHRMFFINNINILYPHAEKERVPPGWNIVYAGGIPLIILALSLGVTRSGVHKFHVTILGLFIR